VGGKYSYRMCAPIGESLGSTSKMWGRYTPFLPAPQVVPWSYAIVKNLTPLLRTIPGSASPPA